MFMIGYPDGQDYWEVGLEDPLEPQIDIMPMLLQPGAVATSSIIKRTWKQGEVARHHLIDPRTGEPANTDWLSVTVLAPHAATAETFAKAFLMANDAEVKLLGEQNPELTVLAVNEAGKLVQLVTPKESLNVSH
jgi:thiamine biosynthesis lipoprotein